MLRKYLSERTTIQIKCGVTESSVSWWSFCLAILATKTSENSFRRSIIILPVNQEQSKYLLPYPAPICTGHRWDWVNIMSLVHLTTVLCAFSTEGTSATSLPLVICNIFCLIREIIESIPHHLTVPLPWEGALTGYIHIFIHSSSYCDSLILAAVAAAQVPSVWITGMFSVLDYHVPA